MEGVRAELLQDALEFYQGFLDAADDPDPAIRWETAQAFARVARIQQYLGRSDDAAAHFRQAIDRTAALVAEFPDRPEFRDGLADAHLQFGNLLVRWPSVEQPGDQFERARRLWQDLAAASSESTRYRARVATCDHLEGLWHKESGRLTEAEAAYQRALATRRKLAERNPSEDSRRDLAMTLHNLANLCSTTSRADDAIRFESEAVRQFEALARARPTDGEIRDFWAGALHNLGILHSWSRRFQDARRSHEQARSLREARARAHPLVPALLGGWAESCMCLAAVDLELGRPADAEPHARQAVDILERLDKARPHDPRGAATLLSAQTNLALLYQNTRRPAEAATVYEQALAVAERLTRAQPDNLNHLTALAALCHNRGNLDRDNGRPRDGLPWYDRAIRAADAALAKDGRLIEAQTWRLFAHGSRAQAQELLNDFTAAVRDWDRVVELSPAADRTTYRLLRTTPLARGGEYDRLEAEVTDLAASVTDSNSLQHLAESCAAAAARATNDSARATAFAVRARSLLGRALAAGDLKRRGEILAAVWTNPDLRALSRPAGTANSSSR
jgi:tetratricopeptide (TPR) repeat protein